MSELKAHKAYNRWIDEEMPTPNDDLICNEVYLKSDVDKVIAELKADYDEVRGRLQTANLIKDEQLAETRHQKYKRCLRNAEGCKNKAWFYGEVHDRNAALTMWKWRKRWLELAEKFKG